MEEHRRDCVGVSEKEEIFFVCQRFAAAIPMSS